MITPYYCSGCGPRHRMNYRFTSIDIPAHGASQLRNGNAAQPKIAAINVDDRAGTELAVRHLAKSGQKGLLLSQVQKHRSVVSGA
jgi:hypothetical protein